MQTQWIGNPGYLQIYVPVDVKNAVAVIMFNDGVEKYAEIRDQQNGLLYIPSNADPNRKPQTYILPSGQTYKIWPYYRESYDSGSRLLQQFTTVTEHRNSGASEVVMHRDLAATIPGGETVKVSITIILVDDDVRPDAVLGPRQ